MKITTLTTKSFVFQFFKNILLFNFFILMGQSIFAQSPVVKVDINMSGRSELECNDPNYTPWIPDNLTSTSKTVNGVTFTFKMLGSNGTALRANWYKAGIQAPSYARLGCDGLFVDGAAAGAQIELTISGLATGTHSLMTFLNALDDPASYTFAPIDIVVSGGMSVTGVVMSKRALTSVDIQSVYLTFNATAGKNVVITFKAQTSGSETIKNIYINGFELNTPNVKEQAKDPIPDDGDMHANGDAGNIILQWTKATSATAHRVYFGTDKNCVATGDITSACYKGQQTGTTYTVPTVYNMDTYYWRIDEVTAAGIVTKGNVWTFRVRHIAFPGAEGYGRFAIGGRGGKVVHVTNLLDDGSAGSLRYAVETETGPRTIVFDVGGIIVSTSRMVCSDPYVTIAGQTAPGKGIIIRSAPLGLTGNDGITRFLRIQIGYGKPTTFDGMGLTGANHSIIDHCSINFAIDEQFSSRSGKNITLQNTFISEALNAADHQNYPSGTQHGYSGSIGGDIGSFHHNLLANNEGRNFSLAGGLDGNGYYAGRLQLVNLVVYNYGDRVTDGGAMETDFINNYYKQGYASNTGIDYTLTIQHENTGKGMQRVYFSGNILQKLNGTFLCDGTNNTCGRTETFTNGDSKKYECFVASQFNPTYVTTQSAKDAFKVVLSNVGCNQPAIDNHDLRVLKETKNGTYTYSGSVTGKKGLPDREGDVGGYENLSTVTRASNWDSDKDGLPDFWEVFYGSNKNSASSDFSDANSDIDKDGYTDLEEYLNWMAEQHYFVAYGGTQTIDLAALFFGFGSSVTYSYSGVSNGTVAISGSTATFTATNCGFATFTLKATESGFTMSRTVNVFVESNPAGTCVSSTLKAPIVAITSPANNTSKMTPANITLTATATDADGTISKVEFYNGSTLIGIATASGSTYSYTWNNVPVGVYTITAKATDNSALSTVSSKISLSVVAGSTTYVYVYDNLGNQSWTYTGNWSPASVPTSIDTAIIRIGEVKVAQDISTVVKVEPSGTFRITDSIAASDIRLQGGTLKSYTSTPVFVLTSTITAEQASTIMAGSVAASIFEIDGTIQGSGDLTKSGVGTLRVNTSGTNYKGTWFVSEGRLQLRNATGLGQCGVEVDSAANLDIEVVASTNALVLKPYATVNLDANLTVQVAVFGNVNVPAGTYTATTYPAFITGTGTLTVAKSLLSAAAPASGKILITAASGTSYSWSNGKSVVSTSTSYTPTVTGEYSVSATTAAGCSVTSSPIHFQAISLIKGWNLISTNIFTSDSSIITLFNGLDVLEIKTMDVFWRKGQNTIFNSLKTITSGNGYLVNMNVAGTFVVAGFVETPNLGVSTGTSNWQLMGCPFQSATPFSTYFNTTNSSIIKNFEGFWIPAGTTNSLQNFELGKGYFIKK